MKKQHFILLLITGLITFQSFAQEAAPVIEEKTDKGRIYIFWGWNRGWYSNSDIHFTGDNYDFTLNDVKANDRQSEFGLDPHFNPSRITIPQTNLRIGYYITKNIDISIAVDHMKYIMPNGQVVGINGYIDDDTDYDKQYINDEIVLEDDFLFFEHSDGLNYLNIEVTRNDDILKLLNVQMNPKKLQIDALIGIGAGALMPKSNVTLWNNERNDDFHLAGYGVAAKVGLNFRFFNFFFIRGELKEGFINMPDIRTSPNVADKASQHFFFSEMAFLFGITVNPFN